MPRGIQEDYKGRSMDRLLKVAVSFITVILGLTLPAIWSVYKSQNALDKDLNDKISKINISIAKMVGNLEEFPTVLNNSNVAIQVAQQHGEEINLIRGEFQSLQGQIIIFKQHMKEDFTDFETSVNEILKDKTDDRFRGKDWEREKHWIHSEHNRFLEKFRHLDERLKEYSQSVMSIDDYCRSSISYLTESILQIERRMSKAENINYNDYLPTVPMLVNRNGRIKNFEEKGD